MTVHAIRIGTPPTFDTLHLVELPDCAAPGPCVLVRRFMARCAHLSHENHGLVGIPMKLTPPRPSLGFKLCL
jgi:hypothetical protein